MAGKTKARFNIVDFLLIALVLLAVITVFLRPAVISQIGKLSASDTVIVSFVADEVTAEQLDQMKEGDLLTCGGLRFGELTSYSAQPCEIMRLVDPENETEQAHFQKVTVQGSHTVKGQLRITGSDRENGFYVNENVYVGVGTVLYLQANSYVLTVQITGIS